MIIPMCCFTCGNPIAHIYKEYLELLDTKLEQSNNESPEFNALATLKIHRECCRRMFICQKDMYDVIS